MPLPAKPGRRVGCKILEKCLNFRVLQEGLLEMQGNVCKILVFRHAGMEHASYLPDIG
ncbi:hypothetical protein OUO20_19510 [Arthrobacter sp. FX8]|uniref:hypothetical protein n=1 Tax=Arthrobacter sp. FX8 TaxID=2997335 RepID=UPI001E7BBBE8|nr:hypothetical protein [Arthrobacter sp. FX8]WAJ33196.1 hypothetical protein OUO20_19510 [Arthrobacter sp. FX8]BCW52934.1 hypothetical protein StoSoilB19_03080 [Arthrobacter sp. StoSoilB19]BCW74017.1 hypothetical protein NicSoilB11_03420 [Arthrobacter sp. NicSoilB11]